MTPEEIQAKIDEAVTGLKNKNSELLGKLQSFKGMEGLDVDKLKADSVELEKMKKEAEEKTGEYKKLYEGAKSESSAKISKLESDLAGATSKIVDMSKKSALLGALSEIKVIPALAEVAVSAILPNTAMDDSGNITVNGKTIPDFMKEWSSSDVGKHFVMSGNSGGGERGGSGGSSLESTKYFDKKSPEFNLTKQAEIARQDPTLYSTLKTKYN